jgi:hypothetical protein
MIKRDVTETVYEYDKEGKLIKKTVTETHEEDNNASVSWPYSPYWHNTPYVNCDTDTVKIPELQANLKGIYDSTTTTTAHNNCQCNCTQD